MENRDRPQDIPFLSKKRAAIAISVPPPLALASCQFLTTGEIEALGLELVRSGLLNNNCHLLVFSAVPAFKRELISENILNRLVKTTVTLTKPPKFPDKDLQKQVYLYECVSPNATAIISQEVLAQNYFSGLSVIFFICRESRVISSS